MYFPLCKAIGNYKEGLKEEILVLAGKTDFNTKLILPKEFGERGYH